MFESSRIYKYRPCGFIDRKYSLQLILIKQDVGKRFEGALDQFNHRFNETTIGAETSLGEILAQLTSWFQVINFKDRFCLKSTNNLWIQDNLALVLALVFCLLLSFICLCILVCIVCSKLCPCLSCCRWIGQTR